MRECCNFTYGRQGGIMTEGIHGKDTETYSNPYTQPLPLKCGIA